MRMRDRVAIHAVITRHDAYRGDTLALKVCSIGEGAHLWETYGGGTAGIDSGIFGRRETLEEKRL